ncbi:hypothetical protein DRP77_01110 [Candidatus Poribacteria bacterium]|nr:MAG: hypothetical protein DRP77_01110 [Candidatus Poribacteria bacterium]
MIVSAAFLLVLYAPAGAPSELTGEEIVKRVNELMSRESVRAEARMTVISGSGGKRTFVYELGSIRKALSL